MYSSLYLPPRRGCQLGLLLLLSSCSHRHQQHLQEQASQQQTRHSYLGQRLQQQTQLQDSLLIDLSETLLPPSDSLGVRQSPQRPWHRHLHGTLVRHLQQQSTAFQQDSTRDTLRMQRTLKRKTASQAHSTPSIFTPSPEDVRSALLLLLLLLILYLYLRYRR